MSAKQLRRPSQAGRSTKRVRLLRVVGALLCGAALAIIWTVPYEGAAFLITTALGTVFAFVSGLVWERKPTELGMVCAMLSVAALLPGLIEIEAIFSLGLMALGAILLWGGARLIFRGIAH